MDVTTNAVVLGFDLAWAAMAAAVGVLLTVVFSDIGGGARRAHRAQSPLDADPSTVEEVRVACFGRPGGLGSSTNVPYFLLTITRTTMTIESQCRLLPAGSWVIRRGDGASLRVRERITWEIADDTTGRWLGFSSPLRAGQATAALEAYGWVDQQPPGTADRP